MLILRIVNIPVHRHIYSGDHRDDKVTNTPCWAHAEIMHYNPMTILIHTS